MPLADAHPDGVTIERIISLIDLTDLDDEHRPDGIEQLLGDARLHSTAAVCVWPEFVRQAAAELAGTNIRVATVVNFPSGDEPLGDVTDEIAGALEAGADEIDVVLPWRRFVDGDIEHAREVIETAERTVHTVPGALLKVILETGELGGVRQVTDAASLAIAAGADFVKTSTGKTATGATPEAAAAMLDVIAAHRATDPDAVIGIKPSGGVRTIADAIVYLDLAAARCGDDWATPRTFRFGASGLLAEAVAGLDALER